MNVVVYRVPVMSMSTTVVLFSIIEPERQKIGSGC